MKKSSDVVVKRVAKMWAIYEATDGDLKLVRKEVLLKGRPTCEKSQVAITIAKGYVNYTMSYEEFIKNAKVSDFIEGGNRNEN